MKIVSSDYVHSKHSYGTNETDISQCTSSMDRARMSTLYRIDSVLEHLWNSLEGDTADAKVSVIKARKSTNLKEYETMAFIAIGSLAIVHSIVRYLFT